MGRGSSSVSSRSPSCSWRSCELCINIIILYLILTRFPLKLWASLQPYHPVRPWVENYHMSANEIFRQVHHLLVPNHRRGNSPKVPQAMSIKTSPHRRKVQKLQTHSNQNPRNHQPRPHRPSPSRLPVSLKTEPSPHGVLDNPDHHVRCHIVCVIPPVPFQVRDVCYKHGNAQHCPCSENGFCLFPSEIQAEKSDRGVVKSIEHAGTGREIIQLLSQTEIPRVKDHAEHPTSHAKVCQLNVVFAHCVRAWDIRGDFREAILVCEEVEEGEEYGERLLHAKEAVERPFSVELDDRFGCYDALAGYYVLAGVIAFLWAIPEEKTVE